MRTKPGQFFQKRKRVLLIIIYKLRGSRQSRTEPPKINMAFIHSAGLLLPDCEYENQFLLMTATHHTRS